MWASKTSCLYNGDFTRFGRFPTSRTQPPHHPYNDVFVALAPASEREPTTIPSAVTPLVCRMKTSIQPMSGADLGGLCVRERLTDPQSSEGAEQVTAHSKMSQSLHNPCVHFLYRGTAALLPPPPLAGFEVVQHGAMFKMTESRKGEGTKTWGHWVEIWFNLVATTVLKHELRSVRSERLQLQRSKLVLYYTQTFIYIVFVHAWTPTIFWNNVNMRKAKPVDGNIPSGQSEAWKRHNSGNVFTTAVLNMRKILQDIQLLLTVTL